MNTVCPQIVKKKEKKQMFKKTKISKKDSRSAYDLIVSEVHSPYMVRVATDTQRQKPEFLTGRTNPILQKQKSTHNFSLDMTLPITETLLLETPRVPINKLTDVLVNLQNKPNQ